MSLAACEQAPPCSFAQACAPAGERFGVGSEPTRMLLRDLDGDGELEFVAVSRRPGTLAVGWGWREKFETWSIGQEPVDVAIGDVDGDGRLDVAAALAGEGAVALLRGAGPGALKSAGRADAGSRPTAIAAADLDGDGRAEIVVADGDSGELRALKWDGARLKAGEPVFAGQGPVALAAADFDQDGADDIAVSLRVDGLIKVFFGAGGGLREGPVVYRGPGPERLAVADFDGDAARDIALIDGLADVAAVAFGDGSGAFRVVRSWAVPAEPEDMVVRQGPKGQELVIQSRVADALTTIDPIGAGATQTIAQLSALVAAGDVDGDGADEVILDAGWTVLRDRPGVLFSPWWHLDAGGLSGPVAVADVDGDGGLDVVVVDRLYGELAAFTAGSPGLLASARSPGSMHSDALILADVDGDGLAEAISWERAWMNVPEKELEPGRVRVDRGLGGGRFAPWIDFVPEADVARVIAWDIEGDGRRELVMFPGYPYGEPDVDLVFPSDRATVYDVEGDELKLREEIAGPLLGGLVGDFDGDAIDELLVLRQVSPGSGPEMPPEPGDELDEPPTQVVLLERGEEAVEARVVGELPESIFTYSGFTRGDLDGDGLPDLVVCGSQDMMLARGLADGTFAAAEPVGDGRRCSAVTIGDGDGDGTSEVLTARREYGMLGLQIEREHAIAWLPELVEVGTAVAPNRPTALALADLDGDGALDMVAAGTDGLHALRGGPGLTLQVAEGEELGAGSALTTALRDVDGDGLDEVIVTGYGGDVGLAMPDGTGSWGPVQFTRVWADDEEPVRMGAAIAGDFDGDGAIELFANVAVGAAGEPDRRYLSLVYALDGGATTVLETGDTFNNISGLASGDLDGDGDDDVVGVLPGLAILAVRLGGPDGLGDWEVATTIGSRDATVVLADVDRDGVLDAAVYGYETQVRVYLGDGRGKFASSPRVWPTGGKVILTLVVADVDDDGANDMLVHEQSGAVFVCPGVAGGGRGGRCRELQATPDGHRTQAIAVDDLDGDGATDVLSVTRDGDEYWLVVGRGGGGRWALHRKPLPGGSDGGALQRARIDDTGRQWVLVDRRGALPIGVPAR